MCRACFGASIRPRNGSQGLGAESRASPRCRPSEGSFNQVQVKVQKRSQQQLARLAVHHPKTAFWLGYRTALATGQGYRSNKTRRCLQCVQKIHDGQRCQGSNRQMLSNISRAPSSKMTSSRRTVQHGHIVVCQRLAGHAGLCTALRVCSQNVWPNIYPISLLFISSYPPCWERKVSAHLLISQDLMLMIRASSAGGCPAMLLEQFFP